MSRTRGVSRPHTQLPCHILRSIHNVSWITCRTKVPIKGPCAMATCSFVSFWCQKAFHRVRNIWKTHNSVHWIGHVFIKCSVRTRAELQIDIKWWFYTEFMSNSSRLYTIWTLNTHKLIILNILFWTRSCCCSRLFIYSSLVFTRFLLVMHNKNVYEATSS